MATTTRKSSNFTIPQDRLGNKKFYFAQGSSPEQFLDQGKTFYERIPYGDSRRSQYDQTGKHGNRKFYGGTTTFEELNEEFKDFVNMPLLSDVIDDFDGVLENIDMGGSFNKDRLIATSNPQGIFDFSLASQGLIRPVEYYSEDLAKDHPQEFYAQYTLPNGKVLKGLIPPNLITRVDGGSNGYIFIYKRPKDNKEYLCIQRQVGVTEALLDEPFLPTRMFGKMQILDSYNKKVVFRSTNKKCYLMYNTKGGKAKNVELYVVQGGLGDATEKGMLLKIMPVLLAAKTLEEAGIKTRIYAVRAYSKGNNFVFMTYPIKNYGERMDWNKIALNVADPRIFRWQMWRAVTGWLDEKHGNIGGGSSGHGSTLTDIEDLSETFERYKNWAQSQRKEGKTNQKDVSRLLMLIGGISSPWSIAYEWDNDRAAAIKTITKEFYRIMDSIDIQLSPISVSAERIKKRRAKEGLTNIAGVKNYINKIITDAYTIPTTGQYATDIKNIRDILEKQQKVFDAYFEWSN